MAENNNNSNHNLETKSSLQLNESFSEMLKNEPLTQEELSTIFDIKETEPEKLQTAIDLGVEEGVLLMVDGKYYIPMQHLRIASGNEDSEDSKPDNDDDDEDDNDDHQEESIGDLNKNQSKEF
ncbi:26S rRNA (cytosine-C(5))-methyltransferase NOP2B-like [Drosophila willistoni]|uniref:26S rRNA (cytosine-C(5))-methyltransferase NOP2B-like n=1 Tax=Drosophila willistoni TaxID=7260 RepID=UPI00017D7E6B|nr:26S rRNA (cytosine-C(5))-methyltransferase NOP2B-like [Drosophila willistoni]